MAFTRKFLSAMGIEADKIDEIIEAHIDVVNGIKEERDKLKDSAEEAENLKKELEEAKKTIEANGTDEYKVKFDELKKEFDTYKAEQDAKALASAKESAYKAMLLEAGVSEKRIDSILKVTDLSNIELDGEELKDKDTLKKNAQEEWADFLTQEHKDGVDTDNPPEGEESGREISIPMIF